MSIPWQRWWPFWLGPNSGALPVVAVLDVLWDRSVKPWLVRGRAISEEPGSAGKKSAETPAATP